MTFPQLDSDGTRWLDNAGFIDKTLAWGNCFMCKERTQRMDVNFGTFFCNRSSCNQAIDDELRKPKS